MVGGDVALCWSFGLGGSVDLQVAVARRSVGFSLGHFRLLLGIEALLHSLPVHAHSFLLPVRVRSERIARLHGNLRINLRDDFREEFFRADLGHERWKLFSRRASSLSVLVGME